MPPAASFVHALPIPAIVIGRDEKIVISNAMAHSLLGIDIDGRHYISVLRQPTALDCVETCLATSTLAQGRFLSRRDNHDVVYRVTAGPLETGVLLSFEDQTDLESAVRMRRDFVSNVSHELRTPLTAILGFIETLRGPARNDAKARETFLGIMDSEAQRMSALVADLSALGRVEETERLRPDQHVDLGALAQSVVAGLRPVIDAASFNVEVNAPLAAAIVPGDENQLRQVLTNLIENAIKYGARGKRAMVTVSTAEHRSELQAKGISITVQDFGEGIEPHHIPRLTERFYRVDRHRSRDVGGTGLGLAIVKHIVNRHRGRLRITSEQGQGSVFEVLLPSI